MRSSQAPKLAHYSSEIIQQRIRELIFLLSFDNARVLIEFCHTTDSFGFPTFTSTPILSDIGKKVCIILTLISLRH